MNGTLWAWVLEKIWKIDTKVLQKREFARPWFENDARLNRQQLERFQEWDRMGKPRKPCDNPS